MILDLIGSLSAGVIAGFIVGLFTKIGLSTFSAYIKYLYDTKKLISKEIREETLAHVNCCTSYLVEIKKELLMGVDANPLSGKHFDVDDAINSAIYLQQEFGENFLIFIVDITKIVTRLNESERDVSITDGQKELLNRVNTIIKEVQGAKIIIRKKIFKKPLKNLLPGVR